MRKTSTDLGVEQTKGLIKLVYVSNSRLPTEKAHGIQIMEMCSAFATRVCTVELVIPNRENKITQDPFEYHDVARSFKIRKLPCMDLVSLGKIGFLVTTITFAMSVLRYASGDKDALYYTRDEIIALCLRLLRRKVVWEGHTGQRNLIVRGLLYFHVPMVVITDALRDLYVSLGVSTSLIFVAPDGADIERFALTISSREARQKLGLPQDKKIALYKGHLYERKGADTLAQAAEELLAEDIICVFIGGTEADVESFRNRFGHMRNVLILGNRPRRETPIYQRAADLLVIPNSAKDDVSRLYTSPMKLFGYLASAVPIIASDLPSLREIVDESLVSFFTPDDPHALAETIRRSLASYPDSQKKAKRAQVLAEGYSWQRRAENIITFSKNLYNL